MHRRWNFFVEAERFGTGGERAISALALSVARGGITVSGVPDNVHDDGVEALRPVVIEGTAPLDERTPFPLPAVPRRLVAVGGAPLLAHERALFAIEPFGRLDASITMQAA